VAGQIILAAEACICAGGVRARPTSFAVPGDLHHRAERCGQDLDGQLHFRPLPADRGRIRFEGRDITRLGPNRRAGLGIGRTFQNLALFGHMSVLDNIMVGRHHLLRTNVLTGALYWLGGAQKEELAHRREVEEIIDFLEIQHVRKATAGTLSYGLRKRVELARAVALKPDLILLDEPMAGMNLEEKEDMARYVDLNEEWGMTVIMIEHDMGVVMDIRTA
jgi:branched-chain amino acid transport system ATP-binding protein